MRIESLKNQLAQLAEDQAQWRSQTAQEWPNDARNEHSAVALRELSEQLANLTEGEALTELYRLNRSFDSLCQRAPWCGDDLTGLASMDTPVREVMRLYGFENHPIEVNATEFIRELTDAVERSELSNENAL